MTNERLEELKGMGENLAFLNDDNLAQRVIKDNDVQNFINDTIQLLSELLEQHRTAPSEEVQEAIDDINFSTIWQKSISGSTAKLCIEALIAYEPKPAAEDVQKLIAKYEKNIRQNESEIADFITSGNVELVMGAKVLQRKAAEQRIILSALRQMQGWIPCSERLPKNRTTVLTFYKDNSGYEEFRASDYDDTKYQPYWNNVTHWMPLPAAPSDDKEGRTPCL